VGNEGAKDFIELTYLPEVIESYSPAGGLAASVRSD
jgi:hypothetical protein